jgi:hypothetical protein
MKHLGHTFTATLSALLLIGSLSGLPVEALSGSQFSAGKIINDFVFTNEDALNVRQIQSFLESKVKTCDTSGTQASSFGGGTNASYGTSRGYPPPYVCLKSYRENPAIPTGSGEPWWDKGRTNLQGTTVNPNGDKSAARIIWDAAQTHRISPKAILVMLQKESSLVTDIAPWPSQYRKAMGYACPDSAACDPVYRGFYNQVSSAARQLRRYIDYPENYNHAVGNTFVRYHPNASCGGTIVDIKTASTAALYNYTPYQPNRAALDNLYGTGNGCSSYGNRNFWRIYNDWFGSTLVNPPPDQPLAGDWNGDGRADIGVKRGDQYLLDTTHDGVADIRFGLGRSTDTPLIGDWDGDGKDEIGLRRGTEFFFDNNNDGDGDVRFGIGRETDVALVGDWNGDGKDSIGLKRGENYFLENNHDRVAEVSITDFGRISDIVLVGDWDRDGKDELGLRRENRYFYNFDADNDADAGFTFGRSTDTVLVGDWDNDDRAEIGLRRNNNYYFDHNNDGDADSSLMFAYY